MRMKAISAFVAVIMTFQSVAFAQFGVSVGGGFSAGAGFGAGVYPGVGICPHPWGMAGGAFSGDDELSELQQERIEKRREKREKERDLRERMREQDRMRTVITDSIQGHWSEPILQHMDNGWNCCRPIPPGQGNVAQGGGANGPPPGVTFIPDSTPGGGGRPPGQPSRPSGGATDPVREPDQRRPGRPGNPPEDADTGTTAPATGRGAARGATPRNQPATPTMRAAPLPPPPPITTGIPGVTGQLAPSEPTVRVSLSEALELQDQALALTLPEPVGSDRTPASVAAAVDSGDAAPSRFPANGPGDASTRDLVESRTMDGSDPRGGGLGSTTQPPQGRPLSLRQVLCPPPYQDACEATGGAIGGATSNCPPQVAPFGTPFFTERLCEANGGIKSLACTSPITRNSGARNSSTCIRALSRYRRLVRDIDRLQREVALLETEISDLADQIGDARRAAREDARLEADCPECAARGRGGPRVRGPSTAQTVVGGLLGAGALALGYFANRQMNRDNQAIGYPGQSFLPYAGYWAGQGVATALGGGVGYPFAGGGMYGGIPSGINGGFGCAPGIGGGGFPWGPGGMTGPYGIAGGPFGQFGGGAFGNPYAQFGTPGGGMFLPGFSPWGQAGIGGAGGFGNPYAGFNPYVQGSINPLGGSFLPVGVGGGGGGVPYGGQAGGFNPLAFGGFPAFPGGGGNLYGNQGFNPYMSYNPYNPLGGLQFGAAGGGAYSPFANPYLFMDASRRGTDLGISQAYGYGNLLQQYSMLNNNMLQFNSGFGTIPGSTYSPYSVYGAGGATLGIGAGGFFGPTPLGTTTGAAGVRTR